MFSVPFFISQSRKLVAFAVPMATYSLVFSSLVVVDTLFAAHLSTAALAAVGVGASLDILFRGFTVGVGNMMRTFIAEAWGRRGREGIGHVTRQGLWVSQMLGWFTVVLYWLALRPLLQQLGLDASILPLLLQYTDASIWALPAIAGFYCLRYLVEAAGKPSMSLRVAIIAALLNVLANWVFMYGAFGVPAMGVFGCGLATTLVYWALFCLLIISIYRHHYVREQTRLFERWEWPHRPTIKTIMRVGTPVGFAYFFLEGFFSAGAFLAAVISTQVAAAFAIVYSLHNIFMRLSAGIGSAANVLLARSLGHGVLRHTRIRFLYIFLFMTLFSAAVCIAAYFFQGPLVLAFGDNPQAQALVFNEFVIFLWFEFFFALYSLLVYALRVYKDTRALMQIKMVSMYGIGVTLMAVLAFKYDLGFHGLILGLCVMMVIYACLLLFRYRFIAYVKHKEKSPISARA